MFSPDPFGRVAPYAFSVSLPLMWEGNQLMWLQKPVQTNTQTSNACNYLHPNVHVLLQITFL